MGGDTVVIDIQAQVTDNTASGAASAERNVRGLERIFQKLQGEITKMGKMSKIQITMYAIDKASKGINSVLSLGKSVAGKAWGVTLKVWDFATAPIRGVINLLKNPMLQIAGAAGITLGVADTINIYANFQQSMADVRAILGATDREMAVLESRARSMG